MLPRPSESSVRPRNFQDPLAYLEQGLPLDGHNTHYRQRPQSQLYHDSKGAHDRDMYEKTHIRQRSGYLSPTLGSFPLPGGGPAGNEDAGTRQRKTAARADQSINDTANSEGTAGLGGLGLGIGLESRREKDGQVVFEKPKRESDQVESAGLTGKDKKAFILLVMLCQSICMRGIQGRC
jgi:hypothetical protein